MIDAVKYACGKHDLDLWAYVIMPEHTHLLIHPRKQQYSISSILSSLKQPVSKKAILYVKQHAPSKLVIMADSQPNGKTSYRFWQRGGGYDRNLWSPRYVWETIDYTHSNPVRRELCASETDWYWSSARDFTGTEDGPIRMNFETLPDDPR